MARLGLIEARDAEGRPRLAAAKAFTLNEWQRKRLLVPVGDQ
jgi:hypothetical protein